MDQKKAKTKFPVIDLIRERWSPRHYLTGHISETELNTMLEAATWSFSGGNLQPWYYLYAHRDTPGFNKILDCITPGNQVWAKNAAVLLVSLAKIERDPGKPNLKAKHDLGAANMLLILQARSMNIYGHPMGGYDSEKIIGTFAIDPSVYEPVVCIALGYLGDPDQLDESQREKELAERTRKGITEISQMT
ncbi:MAG: nitroreductase family protein [Bacteroidia bacterium]|nr:nitroreductase family protein [Bacteroidia bacterium]